MYSYIRSIGFSKIRTSKHDKVLSSCVLENPDWRYILSKNSDNIFIDYYKEYGNNMGISVKGTMDENEEVSVQNMKPFFFTDNIINIENLSVNNTNGQYIACCEEKESGYEFIFYLHNMLDYMDNNSNDISQINIVGLSLYGKIILPVIKDDNYTINKQIRNKNYRELFKKAREGDLTAENQLLTNAKQDSDYIKERLKEDDFLTIIENYFLPTQTEKTNYCVLGDIISIENINNTETDEDLYLFMLDIAGTKLEVCINKKDLIGMPSVGMRFMGQCWLQGKTIVSI